MDQQLKNWLGILSGGGTIFLTFIGIGHKLPDDEVVLHKIHAYRYEKVIHFFY